MGRKILSGVYHSVKLSLCIFHSSHVSVLNAASLVH